LGYWKHDGGQSDRNQWFIGSVIYENWWPEVAQELQINVLEDIIGVKVEAS